MKMKEEPADDGLRNLLKEWRTDATLPPRFEEQVWRRIERTQFPATPSLWPTIARWIGSVWVRPAVATSYVVILLAIAVTTAWAQARQETARVRDELGQRYVRVLDPYLSPRP